MDTKQFNPLTSSIFNSGLKFHLLRFPWVTTHGYLDYTLIRVSSEQKSEGLEYESKIGEAKWHY